MTTRRTFLQATACTALPLSMRGFAAPAAPPNRRPSELHAVLVGSHAVAQSFGAAFAARGTTAHAMPDDEITALWLGAIRPLWERGPAAIAGLTRPAALFCLEQLAWSHGLRVVFHAEHVVHADGSTTHQVQRGAASAGLTATRLLQAGPGWAERLAQAMATHHRTSMDPRFGPSLAALEPPLPPDAQLLTSWIIAAA
jgi:hypothetical protein